MATEATAHAPSHTLPSPGAYLRALYDLGRRSIPLALPALFFLWFYHFGTGLYLEMAGNGGTSPLGFRNDDALLIHTLMKICASLPLLVLVYAPFLPLQDALLRGERIGFVSAIRHVLERMVPLILSVILQILIVAGPVLLVIGGLVAVLAPLPGLPREVVALIAVAALVPLALWLLLSSCFLVFAIPGVILSDLGATRSIAASVRRVGSHFWGLVVRFVVFFVILMIVIMAATLPVMFAGTVAAWATKAEPAFRMGTILWTSLLSALAFPFWVGSLLVLYRAIVPGPAGVGEAAATASLAAPGALHPEGPPTTPYLFE